MAAKMTIEKFLSKKQLEDATGLTTSFIEKAQAKYGLPYYKIGGMVKFKLSEVMDWCEQRKKSS